MGEDLVICWLICRVPPQSAHNGKLWPQNFLSQSECLILLHEYSPERLYLLNSFFVRLFSIMIETYRISFGYWWLLEFFAGVLHLHYMYILYNILFSNFRYWIQKNLQTVLCLSFYIYYNISFLDRHKFIDSFLVWETNK